METNINFNKLSQLDKELMENHNNKISIIEYEKEQQIRINLEQKIRNLYNLINDYDFINNLDNIRQVYLVKFIGNSLYYYQKDNYIKVTELLTEFIKYYGLEQAIKEYNRQETEIKQIYLKKLKRLSKIKTE